jgi:hypothetical protein
MSKDGVSPATRDLANRLLAYEAALDRTLQDGSSNTCHVCEELRRSLESLLGPDAYSSLATRALALAKLEAPAPALASVQVIDNGSIEGLTGEATKANGILVAHLIGLMERFIGHAVTLWLLDDTWPTLSDSPMNAQGNAGGLAGFATRKCSYAHVF